MLTVPMQPVEMRPQLSPAAVFPNHDRLPQHRGNWAPSLRLSLALLLTLFFSDLGQCADTAVPKPYCGADCLYISLRSLDIDVPAYKEFIGLMGEPRSTGFSMEDLKTQANRFKAQAVGVVTTPQNLLARTGRFACIAWLKRGHFVILADVDSVKQEAQIVDCPLEATVSFAALKSQWNGEALLVSREALASEETVALHAATVEGMSLPWIIGLAAIIAGCLLLVSLIVRKWRSRSAH